MYFTITRHQSKKEAMKEIMMKNKLGRMEKAKHKEEKEKQERKKTFRWKEDIYISKSWVMRAAKHCKNHLRCSTTTPLYSSCVLSSHVGKHFHVDELLQPAYLSLLYTELAEEKKKKTQGKANTFDNSLDGMSFRLNRLALCKTDIKDKTLESWEEVAVCNLNP
ncbi:unnamed protein product [Arabis nemorensis]|uniref:Uncharacterized protein n=1 Tax=Arabis nemorensis TaxID=586526 RepID=A0A565AUC3_9BRAS|nr:unnamed protein product [Arabis nemorensis]